MPPPRKIDLVPEKLRDWLRDELAERGFADIVEVTEALNFRLEQDGLELRLGKTAVGEFSKLLKDQREAFGMAETLLADMDIEAEGDIHRTLMQMIATSAMQMMQAVRQEDGHLDAKSLMSLGRMLKDLMQSAGFRERLLSDERDRVAKEARQAAAEAVEKSSSDLGLTEETAEAVKSMILGVGK
ncbi:MAG: phage protein Gp27 family protein [Pseudomonadota bacterium]